jgi:hypothetical protein
MGPCHLWDYGLWECPTYSTRKRVEGRSNEIMQNIDLRSLRYFSQPLDQAVEGWNKHFDKYNSRGVEKQESCNISESWSVKVLK